MAASALPSRCGIRMRTRCNGSCCKSSSIFSRRLSSPVPVLADTGTAPSTRSAARAAGVTRSILLSTRNRGWRCASNSSSTRSTCSACSRSCGLETSETCTSSSARCTSSSVARNALTSVCGRLRMNPTVSESKTLRREGSVTERMVGSSVANIRGEASTVARVSALNSVDLPALV